MQNWKFNRGYVISKGYRLIGMVIKKNYEVNDVKTGDSIPHR